METERLILRHWEEADAKALYDIVKDPDVASPCGFLAHKSMIESLAVINSIYQSTLCYAITLKDGTIVGCIELKQGKHEDEKEIGYFIGKDYWGHGYAPEAVRFLSSYAFENLPVNRLLICYYEGNKQSERVAEKCGYHSFTSHVVYVENYHERRLSHVMIKNKED